MTDAERRETERLAVALRVDYEDADDLIADYTENLSSGGACVSHTCREPSWCSIIPGFRRCAPRRGAFASR